MGRDAVVKLLLAANGTHHANALTVSSEHWTDVVKNVKRQDGPAEQSEAARSIVVEAWPWPFAGFREWLAPMLECFCVCHPPLARVG